MALENVYQPHNASAVLRTCDCFGIQDVHIVENSNKYQVNPDVTLGSDKWLNIARYNENENNTIQALNKIREKGYRIIATVPDKDAVFPENVDLIKGKAAFFFGTELSGLSREAISNADEFVKIPMYGFTESFNISVSAAIILYEITNKLRKSAIKWELEDEELLDIKIQWIKKSLKKGDIIEKEFLKRSRI